MPGKKSTMSSWFHKHFGNTKSSDQSTGARITKPLPPTPNPQQTTKPLIAKNKEETSKMSIKKTFKNAWSKIKYPIWKQILKSNSKEEFEKALELINKEKIKSISALKVAICYVKVLQLYNQNNSKVIMQGKPKNAAAQIRGIVESVNLENNIQEQLLELATRIAKINPVVWGGLIKIIDNSFDSKNGSDTLMQLANTKDNATEQQTKKLIQELSSKITMNQSPNTAPTNLSSKSPKIMSSPGAAPTNITRTPQKHAGSNSVRPLPEPPRKNTALDIANQAAKRWKEDEKGFVEEAEKNMRERMEQERAKREEIRKKLEQYRKSKR